MADLFDEFGVTPKGDLFDEFGAEPDHDLVGATARAIPRGAIETAATALQPAATSRRVAQNMLADFTARTRDAAQLSDTEFESLLADVGRSEIPPTMKSDVIQQARGVRAGQMAPEQATDFAARVEGNVAETAVEGMRGFAKETFPLTPAQERSLPVQVGRGVGSTAGFLATRMLPGGQALLPAFAASVGAGEAIERAMENGASDEEAARAGLMGVAPGLTDIVPIERLLRPLTRIPGVKGALYALARRMVDQGVIEGTQEGVQGFMQNAIERVTTDPNRGLLEDVGRDALVGTLVGMIFGTGASVIDAARRDPEETAERVMGAPDVDAAIAEASAAATEPVAPPALPPPPTVIVSPEGTAITAAQREDEERRRAELGITPETERIAASRTAQEAVAARLLEPPGAPEPARPTAPPQPEAIMALGSPAATEAQVSAESERQRRIQEERRALGLTPDIERVQARQPVASQIEPVTEPVVSPEVPPVEQRAVSVEHVTRGAAEKQSIPLRANVPMRPRSAEDWAADLPGLPQRVYAELAEIESAEAGSAKKTQLQILRGRILEKGEDPETAMRAVWGPELANAPPGLRQAIRSDLALQGAPSQRAQAPRSPLEARPSTGRPVPGAVTPVARDLETQDRRRDLATRKRVAELTPEEMQRELLTDPLTELPNRRAYEEAAKRPVQVAVDLDNLKFVNDTLGHDAGDQLLRTFAQALRDEGLDSYHIAGDEFLAQAESEVAATEAMERVVARLADAEVVAEAEDGTVITKKGVHFSYGTGATRNEADQALNRSKAEREAQGLRAARGDTPPGVTRTPARQQAPPDQPPADQEVVEAPSPEGAPASASEETEQQYDYSSSQVALNEIDAATVREAARRIITPEDIDPNDGLEDRPHITAKFGLHTENADDLAAVLRGEGTITATVGDIEIFEKDDQDVVVLRVESDDLVRLNRKVSDALEHTDTFPDYNPHITLGYVKKGRGKKYRDATTGIEGRTLNFDTVEFSGKDGNLTPIPLQAEQPVPEDVDATAQQAARRLGEQGPEGNVADLREQVLDQHPGADVEDVTEAIHEGQYQAIRRIGEQLPVPVRESDVSLQQATGAFSTTSHTPEKRGRVVVRDYVRTMASIWRDVEAEAQTAEDRQRLTEAFRDFKGGYLTRLKLWLGAHSRVASAFIVGPAKFPVRRNEKRSNTADKRLNELIEFKRKGVKRLRDAVRGPTDRSSASELEVARKKLADRQRQQDKMKAANRVVRDKSLNDAQKVERIVALGISERIARQALIPDFAGRIGFPDYALKNNNAEIRRLTQRIAELEGRQQQGEQAGGRREVPFPGGTVELDYEDGTLRIRHDAKPAEDVRARLKREGFHWSPRNTAWQRKLTDNAIAAAERVTGATLQGESGVSEPGLQEGVAEYRVGEDEAPYQQDLFGAPIERANHPARRPPRGDVHAAVAVRAAVPDTQGVFAVETAVVAERTRTIPLRRVTTPQEAAQATAYLADYADEHFDALVTDADGKPLAIIGAFKGTLNGTAVYPQTLLYEAIGLEGARHVWMSHNHPSGVSDLSRADVVLADRIVERFHGSGVEVMGIFAIGAERDGRRAYTFKPRYSEQEQSGTVARAEGGVEVPIIERVFRKTEALTSAIESPRASMDVVPILAGGTPSLILLDNRHRPVAVVPVTPAQSGALRDTEELRRLYRGLARANAGAAIIANPNDSLTRDQWTNLANMLSANEVRPLDVFDYQWGERGASGVMSHAERGEDLGRDQHFFELADPEPRSRGIPKEAVAIHSYRNVDPLKTHPDYRDAKAGDLGAAGRLVRDLVRPEDIEAARAFGADAVLVPAVGIEATGQNQIPRAVAEYYAAQTGMGTASGIVEINRPHHTGAGAMERLLARPLFDGPVEPGARYVLVDDVTTMGGTLAELANHIQAGGGEVVGVITLTNASRSATMTAARHQVREIERRYGNEIREIFGIDPAGLTRDEASYILGFKDADALRNRAAKAQRQRGARLLSKGIREGEVDDPAFSLDDAVAELAASGQTEEIPEAQRLRAAVEKATGKAFPEGSFTAVGVPDAVSGLVTAINRIFGKKVVFFRNHLRDRIAFNGMVPPGAADTIYLDIESRRPFPYVLGHELLHLLRKDHKDIYNRVYRLAIDEFRPEAVGAFRDWLQKTSKRYGLKPPPEDLVHEEMMANFFGDNLADPAFWERLADRDPLLFRRFVDIVRRFLNRLLVLAKGRGYRSDRYFRDLERMRDAAATALAEYGRRTRPGVPPPDTTRMDIADSEPQLWSMDQEQWREHKRNIGAENVAAAIKEREAQTETEVLRVIANNEGAWTDFEALANTLGIERGRIGGALSRLRTKGLLEAKEAKIGAGAFQSSMYRVVGEGTRFELADDLRTAGRAELIRRGRALDPNFDARVPTPQLRAAVERLDRARAAPRTPPPQRPGATAPTPRRPVSDFHEANKRLRERDRTTWDRAKKFLRRQFSPGGLLPRSVFDEKITRDSNFNAIEFDSRHHVGKLEAAVRAEYGKKFIDLPERTKDELSRALSGEVSMQIPARTREAIYAMRQYIDNLSTEYIGILDESVRQSLAGIGLSEAQTDTLLTVYLDTLTAGTSEEAADAARAYLESVGGEAPAFAQVVASGALAHAARARIIRNNIGEYVHRSYQAFDDPKWFRKLDDETINAARVYLVERYQESGLTPDEAARKTEVTIHEIVKSGTAYDSFGSFIREGKLGAKDLTILMRRKQIAPEIRALLGEYRDARLNYAKSVTKMGRLIWNQRFLDAVQERGLGVFLFRGDNRPPEATKQIAGEASEVYAPLNGLWTFPEVEQAFRDALGRERMEKWYETIVQLNGIVKFGKTVLSPTTAARNWQSAMFFAIANGHFDFTQISKSVSGLREYFTHQGEGAELAYLNRLLKLGVIYDNPYAGEMMRLLADSKIEDTLLRGRDPLKFGQAISYAQKFYQYGDDFWKIMGFENEKRLLMRHAGLSEAAAEKEAAQRIRDTYPTYSMVGRLMHFLRRFPLAGTFVSFPSEIIRTVGNMLRYTAADLKSPTMRPLALRRIAGLSIAASFAYALQAMTKAMLGVDDDEEEALRDLAAPWNENSNFLFIGRDAEGRLQYIDTSYLDPYNYFKRPVNAMLRDQPWEDKAVDMVREMLEPFLGRDIAAGAIFEVLANKKESGGRVYLEDGKPWSQTVAIANHLRKTLQPGVAGSLERTYKALDGQVSTSGKKYDPMQEAAGWLGWRVSTLDPKIALYYRTFEFRDALRDASTAFNRVARDPNEVTASDLKEALENTRELRAEAFRRMGRIVNAARASGLTNSEIIRILRRSAVSRRDIGGLLRGAAPPWQPSLSSRRNAVRNAQTLLGPEKAKEFSRRYSEALRAP